MDINKESLLLHQKLAGKISVELKEPIKDQTDLSLLYSPGVAAPCLEISQNEEKVYDYTIKNNTVAIVSDGSAVLGLGNIKAAASIPVMEGKAALFKEFAGVNAFPICLDTQDDEKIIEIVKNIAPVFGGINLEDINAPRCFYIEEKLKELLDIPVFHDDQHGTAIVCLAGLINALKIVKKDKEQVKIVVNGLGSAGVAITKLLVEYGFKNFSLCGRNGEFYHGQINKEDLNDLVALVVEKKSNADRSLAQALAGADVFIGVSKGNLLDEAMIEQMADQPIVFAMANPDPEVSFAMAQKTKIEILATGRSDYPNQINNVLVFPGMFKGALEVRASQINLEMKLAAVNALVNIIDEKDLNPNYIIPSPFDKEVVIKLSEAVKQAAIASGVARKI